MNEYDDEKDDDQLWAEQEQSRRKRKEEKILRRKERERVQSTPPTECPRLYSSAVSRGDVTSESIMAISTEDDEVISVFIDRSSVPFDASSDRPIRLKALISPAPKRVRLTKKQLKRAKKKAMRGEVYDPDDSDSDNDLDFEEDDYYPMDCPEVGKMEVDPTQS